MLNVHERALSSDPAQPELREPATEQCQNAAGEYARKPPEPLPPRDGFIAYHADVGVLVRNVHRLPARRT